MTPEHNNYLVSLGYRKTHGVWIDPDGAVCIPKLLPPPPPSMEGYALLIRNGILPKCGFWPEKKPDPTTPIPYGPDPDMENLAKQAWSES